MNKLMKNWNETPLLRAATNVINTPIKTTLASPCGSTTIRFNVGNIHEIKKVWSVPAQD